MAPLGQAPWWTDWLEVRVHIEWFDPEVDARIESKNANLRRTTFKRFFIDKMDGEKVR